MKKTVTLRARNWRLAQRFDGQEAEIVGRTSRNKLLVKIKNQKHPKSIDPQVDIYDPISYEELMKYPMK